jgi:antagonist of KipI
MSLSVLQPGLFSLLVDGGRPHHRSLGVSVGGAADRASWQLGNALVGNPVDATALEITFVGPTLVAEKPVGAILFGADFEIQRTSAKGVLTSLRSGFTFNLETGDVLRVFGAPSGVRGYLCVCGGFSARSVLNSQSGFEPVQFGELLSCNESRVREGFGVFCETVVASLDSSQPVASPTTLRVIAGPHLNLFDEKVFIGGTFKVLPTSNRMGLRLQGPVLHREPVELISEPVAPGTIQVTNDGQCIVLGVDGQTIGGYPKIAHVIRADLDILGRLRPGQSFHFQFVTIEEAEDLAATRRRLFDDWLHRIRVRRA